MLFIKFIYYTFLLPPGIFIVILLIFSFRLFRKKINKDAIFLVVITILFYLSSTSWFAHLLIGPLERRYIPTSNPEGDVIILLGGGALSDTPNINGKGHLSGSAANRMLTCLQLHKKLMIPIIVSGGKLFKTQNEEAKIAKNILLSLSIPEDKIIVESNARNTTENAVNTKKLIEKYNFHQPILVTSAYHMPRAVKQFDKVGITVIPYPADYHSNISTKSVLYDFFPLADSLGDVSTSLKEYIGLMACKWY